MEEKEKGGEPFVPNFVLKELASALFFSAFLVLLATHLPEAESEPANPIETPEHIKPEWYFLWNYELLRIIPNKFLGIFIQGLIMAGILTLPFWDRSTERNFRRRPAFLALCIFAVAVWLALTLLGKFT